MIDHLEPVMGLAAVLTVERTASQSQHVLHTLPAHHSAAMMANGPAILGLDQARFMVRNQVGPASV
ncbi:MAG: hypothetical protein JWP20_910 [Roseomonas sp.]|nr:hypothetical protein [Roseomonas sp.]